LFAHRNRNITAENNIFAFNRLSQVDRGGIGGFELTCRPNLICYPHSRASGASKGLFKNNFRFWRERRLARCEARGGSIPASGL